MGCDIHCFVEKKINNKWEKITGFISDYYNPESEYFGSEEYKNADSPIDSRNYTTFAILAGVRNGSMFGASDDAVKPISDPKGLPIDICKEIKKESDEWDCDGHSHSWLTVKEIANYNRNEQRVKRGYVSFPGYVQFLESGSPNSWYGGVGGGNVEIIEPSKMLDAHMENLMAIRKKESEKSYYCLVEWSCSICDYTNLFDAPLKQLIERCDSIELDDVRIVFWFDN